MAGFLADDVGRWRERERWGISNPRHLRARARAGEAGEWAGDVGTECGRTGGRRGDQLRSDRRHWRGQTGGSNPVKPIDIDSRVTFNSAINLVFGYYNHSLPFFG